jgi:hypothetical protein
MYGVEVPIDLRAVVEVGKTQKPKTVAANLVRFLDNICCLMRQTFSQKANALANFILGKVKAP